MADDGGDAQADVGYVGARNERNERHGVGKAVFENGDAYEGGYINGRRHGTGKYTFKSGAVYDGDYHNNAKHGTGKMSYADKSVYDGQWKMDRRHGQGSYVYANGDVYAGAWCNGVKHGKGMYFFMASKCQFFGYWNDAKFTAGTWVMQDGSTYVGSFEGGPTGPGTYRFPDGTAVDGSSSSGGGGGSGSSGKSKFEAKSAARTAAPATLDTLVASTGVPPPKPLGKKKPPPDMSFVSDECPASMPDLSAHTNLLAQVRARVCVCAGPGCQTAAPRTGQLCCAELS
eukprot:SAG22_NODE_904_length_6586_cov_3.133498_6_plen_286_part_00